MTETYEFAAEYALDGDTLTAVVHVFGTTANKYGRLQQFDPHAFDDTLGDAIGYYAHDKTKPLAKPELAISDGKLVATMTLGHQSYANDLRENHRLGLMNQMSFGVQQGKYTDRRTSAGTVRYHTKARLYDVSPVVQGAFEGTTSLLHSADPDDRRREAARARARVLGGTP